ncbi:MAG: type IV toxin-antitoxin system AbiEi family antitoxin [Gemmatimonadaceae bacterium]
MRDTRRPPINPGRLLRDPFADRASLLCRTLLANPGAVWHVRGLAEAAGVAPMLSSDVVRQLESAGIVTTQPRGRQLLVRLVDPQTLLEQWTAVYRYTRNATLHFAAAGPTMDKLPQRLARAAGSRRWALTLLAGAWQRNRYTPTERLHVYMECEDMQELRSVADREGWPEDAAGSLVLMKPAYRTATWHQMSQAGPEGLPVVSDLQLILDLWHYPERGRETAEQLWRPILRGFERASVTKESVRGE